MYTIVRKYVAVRRERKGMHMTDKEQATALIEEYAKLQRIKSAADREAEIEYQIRITKAKLEAIGIVAEDLDK